MSGPPATRGINVCSTLPASLCARKRSHNDSSRRQDKGATSCPSAGAVIFFRPLTLVRPSEGGKEAVPPKRMDQERWGERFFFLRILLDASAPLAFGLPPSGDVRLGGGAVSIKHG